MKVIRNKLIIMLAFMALFTIVMPSKVKAVSIIFTDDIYHHVTSGSETFNELNNPNISNGSITVTYVAAGKVEIKFTDLIVSSKAIKDGIGQCFNIKRTMLSTPEGYKLEDITDLKIILEGENNIAYDVTDASDDKIDTVEGFGIYAYDTPITITGGGSLMIEMHGTKDREVVGYNNMNNLKIENAKLIVNMYGLNGTAFYMDPGTTYYAKNPSSLTLLDGAELIVGTIANGGKGVAFNMPAPPDESLPKPVFNISNGAKAIIYGVKPLAKSYVNNSTVPTLGSNIKAKGVDEPYNESALLKYDITDPIQHRLLSSNQYIEFSELDANAFEYIISDVTIDKDQNGTVKLDEDRVKEYHEAKLTITPDAGYKLKSVKILKAEDDTDVTTAVKYDAKENTFEMPGYEVKAKVEFEKIDYKLSAASTDGKVTFENDITTAQIGDQFKVILTPANESYILDKLTVTNTDTKEDVTSIVYDAKTGKITMKDYPITVTTTFKKTYTYEVISGDNSKVEKDEIKDVEIKIDGNYKEFTKVYVDDLELPKTNYDSKEGSTIITLKKSYLETLKPGIYKMKVAFENSTGVKKDVETTFEIKEKTVQTKPEADIQTKPNGNPQTGDNILMYVALLVLSTISCGVVILRKRQLNKIK